VVTQHAGPPLLSGMVPPVAERYYPRAVAGLDQRGLLPGRTIVLTPAPQTADGPPAEGGTGKTQLAAGFAQALWNARAVDVLVWVTAGSREAVLTGFASAASAIGAADPDEDAATAASRFRTWLAGTRRPWALFIDDLADPADLDNSWPSGPSGQVIITTRLTAAELERAAGQLSIVPVGALADRDALSYMFSMLAFHDQRAGALGLCEDLDGLPLAITQAAGVINARHLTCREYTEELAERSRRLSGVRVAGMSTAALAAWLLAVECAQRISPEGLAWPVLRLAACLGPHGIPAAVLTSQAACGIVTGRPGTADPAGPGLIRAAITNLGRLGLVSIDTVSPAQLVRIHPSVQAAARAHLAPDSLEQVVAAAANALAEAWPAAAEPVLDQILRDCVSALRATSESSLWKPEVHPLLFRAGRSLEDSRLSECAMEYWQSMVTTSSRLLGPAHASTVAASDRLGTALEATGHADDAITVLQTALAVREQSRGPDHPETIDARAHLAHAYEAAGRLADAVAVYESTVAGLERQFGRGDPHTLAARASLAAAYQSAGLTHDSLAASKMVLADAERLLGTAHPTTLVARASLAEALQDAGQPRDAARQHAQVLAHRERAQGADHPDTIAARASLASALRRAGKSQDAIRQYEQVLTDRERVQGPDHPDTMAARANLAFAYRSAGQLRAAIPAYERTLADRERLQGPDHKDTRTARTALAGAYQQAGRVTEAIPHYQRALADSERVAGPGDTETLSARSALAAALYAEGRLTESVEVLAQALADCELHLGPSHPMTQAVRDNLAAATGA
jgi:tetratricopeptide (TPR) repeat protein